MSVKQPVRPLRSLRVIVIWILGLALLIAIGWLVFQAASTFSAEWNSAQQIRGRSVAYAETASAIAPTLTTYTPPPTETPTETLPATETSTASETPTATETATASWTASSEPPTNTLEPSATATDTAVPPTPTPIPPSLTVTPAPLLLVSNTPLPTDTRSSPPLPASNTPPGAAVQSLQLPSNTVAPTLMPAASETPAPSATLPPPTATAEPTATPTLTATVPPTLTPAPEVTAVVELALPALQPPPEPDPSHIDVTAIPPRVEPVPRNYRLVNILLMGTDGEITNDGTLRTDAMIIVSINRDTNSVAMLNLPRDLFVWIPDWSMQRLNLAYGWGESVGYQPDGGWGAVRHAIWWNLGINVHYYAMVNISDFVQIIDTVGGVNVAVDCALEDTELIGATLPAAAVPAAEEYFYVLPVGYYHLSGAEAVWYARSRHNSSDFDRGRRQQQLLRAIWRAARDNGLITQFPELWEQTISVVDTNLDFNVMLELLPIALNMSSSDIETFTPIRGYHTIPWQPPDGANVQLLVPETIRALLDDFYTPPTTTQVDVEGASVMVYNGTTNEGWDRVAGERLLYEGFSAIAAGPAETISYTETIIIDYTGSEKGSSLEALAEALNVRPENVRVEPDPNRTTDFAVILGSSYNSCDVDGVIAVTPGATATP